MSIKKTKIERNDKCPCGSGKKYKKCHLDKNNEFVTEKHLQADQQLQANEFQRKEQQGFGREIISADHSGYKFVAVGSRLFYSKTFKTFHDFLVDYIKALLGADWINGELKKPLSERHPILQWYQHYYELQEKNKPEPGKIASVQHTGASIAFLGLAYNFYLLEHNEGIQSELIRRVKLQDKTNFHGALYETYVAAYFINAGYELEFENELDGSTTHCEFTATNKETGRKFSVEAKAREPKKKGKTRVISRLRDALGKSANYERIVFIDIGKSPKTPEETEDLLVNTVNDLRNLESLPLLGGEKLPKAYVIITNNSFWWNLSGHDFRFSYIAEGFKIPGFKRECSGTIRDLLEEAKKHKEIDDLLASIKTHQEIPSTFGGENPEIAFSNSSNEPPPLIIGNQYLVPSDTGTVPAILRQACVDKKKKLVFGLYEFENGNTCIFSCPLTDIELAAYQKHPRTFFGTLAPTIKLNNPLEFYEWVYSKYKNTPKEKLLEFMQHYPNQAELVSLSQEDLAKIYCKGVTASAVGN